MSVKLGEHGAVTHIKNIMSQLLGFNACEHSEQQVHDGRRPDVFDHQINKVVSLPQKIHYLLKTEEKPTQIPSALGNSKQKKDIQRISFSYLFILVLLLECCSYVKKTFCLKKILVTWCSFKEQLDVELKRRLCLSSGRPTVTHADHPARSILTLRYFSISTYSFTSLSRTAQRFHTTLLRICCHSRTV